MAVAFLTSVLLWPYDGMSEFKFYTHYVLLVVALHNAISKVVLTVLSHADECINKYSPSMRKHEFVSQYNNSILRFSPVLIKLVNSASH